MATEDELREMRKRGVEASTIQNMFKYIKSVDEMDFYFNCVLYGDGGVGKTVLVARIAQALGTKALIISTDNGAMAIENHPSLLPYVNVVKFISPAFLADLAIALRYDSDEFNDYGVVSLDTTSGICDQYLDRIVSVYNSSSKRGGGRDALRPKDPNSGLPTLYTASDEDYKFLRTFMRPIIQDLAESKKAVFQLTHERAPFYLEVTKAKQDNEKPPKMRPDVPDKVYKVMLYGCHVMGHMVDNKGQRTISCIATEDISVKSRIKGLYNEKVSDDKFVEIVTKWIRERSNRD